MQFLELPDLPVGVPAQIAVSGISQIDVRNFCKTSICIKPRCTFVGDRLAVGETVVIRRTDRRFVGMFSVEHLVFDARDFSADERGFGLEICGAMPRPYFELPMVVVQSGVMLFSFLGRS